MDAKEHAKILASKYTGVTPTPVETVSYLEPSIMCNKVLFSPRKGEIDRLLLPLEPTIFMTKRNSDRRAAPTPKKSLFKKLFGFLG